MRENIPNQLKGFIPEKLPKREAELARSIALRPEEFETDVIVRNNYPTLVVGTNTPNNIWTNSVYEVKETPFGIQLLPRKY